MTPVALIVEHETPDLLALCLASLRRFAPEVTPIVLKGGPGAAYHAMAIEDWRALRQPGDPVILLDTDTVILSEQWWERVRYYLFNEPHELVGGHRTRGDACQMFWYKTPLLHASMLAMRRHLFDLVHGFGALPLDDRVECVTRDTAWEVSFRARSRHIFPYVEVAAGRVFQGLQVGEYYDDDPFFPLWSHLWRGTGMPAGPPWRRALRVMRAACGSESAKTMLRAEERKRAWMARAWEVVNA